MPRSDMGEYTDMRTIAKVPLFYRIGELGTPKRPLLRDIGLINYRYTAEHRTLSNVIGASAPRCAKYNCGCVSWCKLVIYERSVVSHKQNRLAA
jgi:hypothetical protein